MFNNITPLEFYCHKILPLVYDDSLSYYEVLCKVQQKLNELIENNNELIRQWELYKNEIDKAFGEYKKQLQAQLDEMRADISAFEELIRNEIDAFKNSVNDKLAAQTAAINAFKTEVNAKLAEQDGKIDQYYNEIVQTENQHKTEVQNILNGFETTMNESIASQNQTIQNYYNQMVRSEKEHKDEVKAILAAFEAKLNKAIADYNASIQEIPSIVNRQIEEWFSQNMDSIIDEISRNLKFPDPIVQMCDEKVYAQIRKADVNTDLANQFYLGHSIAVVDVNNSILGIPGIPQDTKIKVMFTLSHVNINSYESTIAMYGFDIEHDYTGFKKLIHIPNSIAYPENILTMFADSQFVYYASIDKNLYKTAISSIVAAQNGADVEGTQIATLTVKPDAGCLTEKGEMYIFSAINASSSSLTYYKVIPSSDVSVTPETFTFNYNHFYDHGYENPRIFIYTDVDNIYIGGKMHIGGICNRIDVYRRNNKGENGSQYLPVCDLECVGGACYNNKEVYFLHQASYGGLIFSGTNRVTTANFDFVRGNLAQRNNIRTFNADDFADIHCNKDYTGFFVDGTSGKPYPHLRDAISSYYYINSANVNFYLDSDMCDTNVWGGEKPIVIDSFPNGVSIFGGDTNKRLVPFLAFKNCPYVRVKSLNADNSERFSSLTVHEKYSSLYFENCSYVEVINTKITAVSDYAISAINAPVHIKESCEISDSGSKATFYSDITGAIYFDSDITLPSGATIESPHINVLPSNLRDNISMTSKQVTESIPDISGCNIKEVRREGKYKYDTSVANSNVSFLPGLVTGIVWVEVKNLGSEIYEYTVYQLTSSRSNVAWVGYSDGNTITWRPSSGYALPITFAGTTGTITVHYSGSTIGYIHGSFTTTSNIPADTTLYTLTGSNVFNNGVGENPVEISGSSGAVIHGLNITNNLIKTTRELQAGTYSVSGEFALSFKTI